MSTLVFEIRRPKTTQERGAYRLLRRQLLHPPGTMPKLEPLFGKHNPLILHLAAFVDDLIVAIGSIQPAEGECWAIYGIGCTYELRRQGVTTHLMHELEEHAHEHGATQIMLYSRPSAVPFYMSLGYSLTDDFQTTHDGRRNPQMVKHF